MKIAVVSTLEEDVFFVINIKDESRVDEARHLIYEGWKCWNDAETAEKHGFNEDFIDCAGWAEPSECLLDEAGIDYEGEDATAENGVIYDAEGVAVTEEIHL